jgi:uncharacterized protein with ATP-grasp and redox domains
MCHYLGLNEAQQWAVYQDGLRQAAILSPGKLTPPEYSEKIYQAINRVTGLSDPYRDLRQLQNDFVLHHLDYFEQQIQNSASPLRTAAIYSLAGNLIDFGSERVANPEEILKTLSPGDLTIDDFSLFTHRLARVKKMLFIADNAGEAVLDRLFIKEIRMKHPEINIHYGVRSRPIINDIIESDARYIKIHQLAKIIESGSTFAGTVIRRSNQVFQELYRSADLVIAKGQGNFETLESEDRDILFLLKIKCRVVSRHTGLPHNSLLFAFRESIKKAADQKNDNK